MIRRVVSAIAVCCVAASIGFVAASASISHNTSRRHVAAGSVAHRSLAVHRATTATTPASDAPPALPTPVASGPVPSTEGAAIASVFPPGYEQKLNQVSKYGDTFSLDEMVYQHTDGTYLRVTIQPVPAGDTASGLIQHFGGTATQYNGVYANSTTGIGAQVEAALPDGRVAIIGSYAYLGHGTPMTSDQLSLLASKMIAALSKANG